VVSAVCPGMSKAVTWYRKAAEAGDAFGMNCLGSMDKHVQEPVLRTGLRSWGSLSLLNGINSDETCLKLVDTLHPWSLTLVAFSAQSNV
jgi:hypothetical protein